MTTTTTTIPTEAVSSLIDLLSPLWDAITGAGSVVLQLISSALSFLISAVSTFVKILNFLVFGSIKLVEITLSFWDILYQLALNLPIVIIAIEVLILIYVLQKARYYSVADTLFTIISYNIKVFVGLFVVSSRFLTWYMTQIYRFVRWILATLDLIPFKFS